MRILYLANATPWPPRGGGQMRIFHLLSRIASHHQVVLGCHAWTEADLEQAQELRKFGITVVAGLLRFPSNRRWAFDALMYGLRGLPPESVKLQSPELHALVRAGAYDVLQIEETILAPYFRSMPINGPQRRVLALHNVHFLQEARMAQIERSHVGHAARRFNGAWMRWYEPRLAEQMDRVITMSETDSTILKERAAAARTVVVPNGVDTRALAQLPPPGGPPALLFIGSMMYRPCVDAAIWLVREILPLIRRTHPAVEVWIVGRGPVPEVLALAGDGVTVTGEVEDVRPYYERATLAVAPLRAGSGTRLKILEAMAIGRAMVATTIGAEGLHVVDGEHLVLADDAASMANAVTELLDDPVRRETLAMSARRLVESRYDWDHPAAALLQLYDELAAERSAS